MYWTLFWIVAIGVSVIYSWRAGHLTSLANYVRETREEMKKCTWPTWNELKGSTVVVMISIGLLGLFTIMADGIFYVLIRWIWIT